MAWRVRERRHAAGRLELDITEADVERICEESWQYGTLAKPYSQLIMKMPSKCIFVSYTQSMDYD